MLPLKDDTYFALARKWRPQQFDEVIGQEHITRTLKNAVLSGRVHHALLFIGSRGVGKTTTARILAKALNCLSYDKPTPTPCDKCENCVDISRGNHLDVQEIDGASNNSVDNVREIREAVRLAPVNARYKVYIIDEVHQLSSSAFNALLKTLEEPPPHAIFVLATTEAHKIPATIISRCQRFDFRRVSVPDIMRLLEKIVIAENRKATKEALYAIARVADGAVRDAESILDQLMTYCVDEITYKDVQDVLGLIEVDSICKFVEAVRDRKLIEILQIIDSLVVSGKDLYLFVDEVISFFRNMLVLKATHNPDVLCLPKEDINRLKSLSEGFTTVQLIRLVEQLASISQIFTSQISHRTVLEAFFVKYCKIGHEISIESILEKLITLEEYVKEGVVLDSKSLSSSQSERSIRDAEQLSKKSSGEMGVSSVLYTTGVSSAQEKTPRSNISEGRVKEGSSPIKESANVRKLSWDVVFNMLCNENATFALKFAKVKSAEYDEAKKTLILESLGDYKEISNLLNLLKDAQCLKIFKGIGEKLQCKIECVKLKQERVSSDDSGDVGLDSEKAQNNLRNAFEVPPHVAEIVDMVHGSIVGIVDKQEQMEELDAGENEDEHENLGEGED